MRLHSFPRSFLLLSSLLLALLATSSRAQSSPLRAAAGEPRTSITPTEIGWIVDGYKFAPESTTRILDALASHQDSAAVLGSLVSNGTDPAALAWSSLRSLTAAEAGKIDPKLLPSQDQFAALRHGVNEILSPVDLALRNVEVWTGFASAENGSADRVVILVGTVEGGEARMIHGRHDRVENGTARVAEFEGAFVDEAAAGDETAPIAKIKWGKVKDKWAKFKACFKSCLSASAPPMTALQVICLTAGAVGCIPATGGWPACFTGAAAFCGLTGLGLTITMCGLYALGC